MSKNELMRYKFLEILARISKAKYIDTDKEDRVSDSLARLIKEVLMEHYQWEPWMEFRNEKLWTVEVNDVLKVNV